MSELIWGDWERKIEDNWLVMGTRFCAVLQSQQFDVQRHFLVSPRRTPPKTMEKLNHFQNSIAYVWTFCFGILVAVRQYVRWSLFRRRIDWANFRLRLFIFLIVERGSWSEFSKHSSNLRPVSVVVEGASVVVAVWYSKTGVSSNEYWYWGESFTVRVTKRR